MKILVVTVVVLAGLTCGNAKPHPEAIVVDEIYDAGPPPANAIHYKVIAVKRRDDAPWLNSLVADRSSGGRSSHQFIIDFHATHDPWCVWCLGDFDSEQESAK